MRKFKLILFFLVLFFGIFLRSIEVINKNPIFGFDQGRDFLAVRKIVVDKKLTLIGAEAGSGMAGLAGIFHGPYFYYLLVLPFLLFKGDPYGGLVLMFIFGVASLIFCFYLLKKFFGFWPALIAMLLMDVALSAQSRFVWSPHPATFFILLSFWFTYEISQNPQKYFFWATFFSGLIYGFELGVSIPLIFSIFIFVFLILKIKNIRVYLSGVLGVILSHLPFFAFEARHGFMASKGVFRSLIGGQEKIKFIILAKSHALDFWFNFRSTFLFSDRLVFWLFIFLVLSLIYFLVKAPSSPRKNFVCFLSLLPLSTFVVFMFLSNTVWGYYLIHLHLAYILLFAILATKSKLPLVKIVFILFLILMLPGIFKEAKKARVDLRDYGGVAKMKGKIEAIDWIYQDAKGEPFNVLVFTPPVYDYAYQYLLKWYGQQKYGYVPGNEKKGLFYLWIEPDAKKPWSYKGWLETVIKTGKVIKEEELPSGFIIQKRDEKN